MTEHLHSERVSPSGFWGAGGEGGLMLFAFNVLPQGTCLGISSATSSTSSSPSSPKADKGIGPILQQMQY